MGDGRVLWCVTEKAERKRLDEACLLYTSAASCTTNCLAPMAKALNDAYPIQSGIKMCIRDRSFPASRSAFHRAGASALAQ